ncbi:MAG: hypothetical protein WC430_01645 [Patescibacteria group bacterium]
MPENFKGGDFLNKKEEENKKEEQKEYIELYDEDGRPSGFKIVKDLKTLWGIADEYNADLLDALKNGLIDKDGNLTEKGKKEKEQMLNFLEKNHQPSALTAHIIEQIQKKEEINKKEKKVKERGFQEKIEGTAKDRVQTLLNKYGCSRKFELKKIAGGAVYKNGKKQKESYSFVLFPINDKNNQPIGKEADFEGTIDDVCKKLNKFLEKGQHKV